MAKRIYTRDEVIDYFLGLHSDYSVPQIERMIAVADRDELPPEHTVRAGYQFPMLVTPGRYNILREINGKLTDAEVTRLWESSFTRTAA